MVCPLCNHRKARRSCPALNQTICPVCCGTKRLVEIKCPSDCVYLASAREHPAAVVRRQQERDVMTVLPTLQGLSERQYQLFLLIQELIARHVPEGFARLIDDDVAEAAGAVAATLETSARGVIYEHVPQSLAAQRLAGEIKSFIAEIGEKAGTVFEREAAAVLRSIEKGARDTRKQAGALPQAPGVASSSRDGGDTAYLQVMSRLLQQAAAPDVSRPEAPVPSQLIIP